MTDTQRQQQSIQGNLITFYIVGDPGEVKVVFLHGWASESRVWFPLMQQLHKEGVASIAVDLPGFGSSVISHDGMSIGDYASVVNELLQKLHIQKSTLVGHSFGGRIGIVLASQHPVFLSKLVLVDSAGFAKKPNSPLLLSIARPFFRPQFMQGIRRFIYTSLGAADYLATPSLVETFKKAIAEDLMPYLPRVEVPTLLLWGSKDRETPLAYGTKMNLYIPDSRLVVLQGAGHFSFLDKPQEAYTAIRDFVHGPTV